MADPYFAVVYLKVRKRERGAYNGRDLVVKAFDRSPKDLKPGEYVVRLRLFVPRRCLTRESGMIDVRVAEPGEPTVEQTP